MKFKIFLLTLIVASIVPVLGFTRTDRCSAVDVRIIGDGRSEYPRYRAHPSVPHPGSYFYMEAVKGERYSIEVANRSARRIGVVIAVDGRNIISGEKSYLKNSERMYIIEPYTTNTFEGWRTGMQRTNRFFFTEQSNSYAEKVFSDASAMGTIAVAVYREKYVEKDRVTPSYKSESKSSRAAGKGAHDDRSDRERLAEQAGTGFGETTYSPAREVQFDPENVMAQKIVLKYEWRSELCKRGIVNCGPKNRFWPDSVGFAPIPNDFRD